MTTVPLVASRSTSAEAAGLPSLSDVRDLEAHYECLIRVIEARCPFIAGHSERVAILACRIGEALGLSQSDLTRLHVAARLHDIGKITVDPAILDKGPNQPLTDDEWQRIKLHPQWGEYIIGRRFPLIAAAIRHHHEAYNGMGYPDQLIGNEIPLFARIIAVCDSYDAMISDRPYRVGMEPHEARAILVLDNGCQWDEDLVAILLGVLTSRTGVLA